MEKNTPENQLDLAPFPLSQLQEDLAEVFFHHLQNIGRLVDAEAAWTLISKDPLDIFPFQFLNPEESAKGFGFTFSMIAHTSFAQSMINLYNYAYSGRLDRTQQKPEGESDYVWYTTLCCDVADGATGRERIDHGSDVSTHASRCVQVAETANARNMLEGEEPFYYFHGATNKESSIDFEGLTIRQLALLAGMEEGSVRAATNPKRAKPLVTFKSGNRTLVNFEVAKEWLADKGRYIPVTYFRSSTVVDWNSEEIDGIDQFNSLLAQHVSNLLNQIEQSKAAELLASLARLGTPVDLVAGFFSGKPLSLTEEQIRDEALMHALAQVVQVSPEIFALRAKETVLVSDLERVMKERKLLILGHKEV
ncbi:hypothetical protein H0A71_18835 [Alcaligenaceae bacterium]|nr:hypothetical protein [Alcaligenaceae bacterium]